MFVPAADPLFCSAKKVGQKRRPLRWRSALRADCTRRQGLKREASETRCAQTADASFSVSGPGDASPSDGDPRQRQRQLQLSLRGQRQLSLRGQRQLSLRGQLQLSLRGQLQLSLRGQGQWSLREICRLAQSVAKPNTQAVAKGNRP